GATIFIPSENEWYKAAYYNPAGSYNQYPFSSNTVPTSAMPGSTPNTGNFTTPSGAFAVTGSTSYSGSQNYLTAVGAYTASASPYGLYDMGGDVFQLNESLILGYRGLRGGSWAYGSNISQSSDQFDDDPGFGSFFTVGFRVASTIPEPSTAVLAIIACGLMWVLRKRFK
ncbi:MAG TPA: SUMF1/EgtB/PvdO family nonheme iron enzyme, partial [Pirellulales bacterium]|nr:SUMF1/EgtB/PvdO family nonheme iron enzyme [Pirellulales bacterium]